MILFYAMNKYHLVMKSFNIKTKFPWNKIQVILNMLTLSSISIICKFTKIFSEMCLDRIESLLRKGLRFIPNLLVTYLVSHLMIIRIHHYLIHLVKGG